MSLNWIDWIILLVIMYYVLTGWEQGVFRLVSSLAAFVTSLLLAIKYHGMLGVFLVDKFGIAAQWGSVVGFAVIVILGEIMVGELIGQGLSHLPEKIWKSKVNRGLGALLSAANGLAVMTIAVLLFQILPLRGTIKQDLSQSQIASWLVVQFETYAPNLKASFNQSALQAIRFLTIRPTSDERIELPVSAPAASLKLNPEAEREMVELVNAERAKSGLKPLIVNTAITEVAREYSRDMFTRRYFSHVSPEGEDAADRLQQAEIRFTIAGENLAYAPDVQTAHEGLMNSEGHRKNILTAEFGRVGIGVIDGGIYGMMFTQNFTD